MGRIAMLIASWGRVNRVRGVRNVPAHAFGVKEVIGGLVAVGLISARGACLDLFASTDLVSFNINSFVCVDNGLIIVQLCQ